MSPHTMPDPWFDSMADAQACACWLNCYLREFAIPRGTADFDYTGPDRPGARSADDRWLRIALGDAGVLCVRIAHADRLGRCRFVSTPFLKAAGQPWQSLDAHALARSLLQALGNTHAVNPELLAQSDNSVAITAALLRQAQAATPTGDALIDAEQALLWGHALHPTPKSREGVALAQVLACAPEARAAFALYWFRIDPRLLRVQGRDVRATLQQLSGHADLYPCHPWEVQRLRDDPLLQELQARGAITPVGVLGEPLRPTSSVRTLYHPALAYFLKCSVHVRLTNCVRKNAWYELESAVALTHLLAPSWQALAAQVPGFDVMLEPAATSLDVTQFDPALAAADPLATRALAESFGILYRQAPTAGQRARWRPQVAAALFTCDAQGHSVAAAALRAHSVHRLDRHTATVLWFRAYAGLLLDGVWSALFQHGIALEPHLQNTVIGFSDGWPTRVWIRDLEGTKLLAQRWPAARLHGVGERARQSLYYTPEQAWNRVAYCALVNNLAEAIFHLSDGDAVLEARLWQCVAEIAARWQQRNGAQPALQGLIDGAPLPGKNNLGTRLLQRADRQSDYTALPNPIAPMHAVQQVAA
ncbi:IucA/IucC family protein [Xanthomonas campestris]|uniref:IucA/IucC family protein n=1 Tax=Xanthomonas campestris TaxID=339 RepID=UPI00096E7A23|nr:IucA/IucC family protein [Xanthomonas campestris]MCF8825558.1 iron transporter [Xanthomonas campestris pv. raphani]MEA9838261.1 IucA/IucC family protein [Xanthomonas campestris pv. raphani]MEA9875932.1 IucA/IucC family protein [Xanthomonas campestris pv. raphani]MEA9890996.1 IucA/IucC family protein [Xanthomonas campestris pv. raphani]MEA9932221.1 IucA/IucC family protein [Xanthomonas campestris pv. raphani]